MASANHAYRCAAGCASPPDCQNGGFVDKTCRCVCPPGVSGQHCETAPADYRYYGQLCGDANVTEAGTIDFALPRSEEQQHDCYWLVTAPKGHEVLLTLRRVSMSSDASCAKDQMAVSVRGDLRRPSFHGCGRQLSGRHYRSDGGRLLVYLRTREKSRIDRRFEAHVSFVPAE